VAQSSLSFGFVLPSSRPSGGGRVAPPRVAIEDAVGRHDRRRLGDGRDRRVWDRDDGEMIHRRSTTFLSSASSSTEEFEISSIPSPSKKRGKKRRLGLLTFDLDDTLYPIAPVLDEANAAFSTAMSNFGYVDIRPSDIVETGKEIRANLGPNGDHESSTASTAQVASDPLRPKTVNHKEIRMAAIRKEMEDFILKTKLKQTAADWATEVDSITSPVRKSAEK
jgi:hypothetical protein